MGTQISAYIDDDEKQTFEAHAQAQGMSISEWVAEACREKVEPDALADDAQRFRFEQRLLTLVDEAADRASDQIVAEVRSELEKQNSEE